MRAFVIVSALFAVSSLGSVALAHEGADRDPVSRPQVVRDHVVRERAAREHVVRDHVVRDRVAVDRAPRPDLRRDHVARPTDERGERRAASAHARAGSAQASAPVPRTLAAMAAPRVNCDPGSDGCATPRSSSVEKAHGSTVTKSSTAKKDAPKVDKATSDALKRVVLSKRCAREDSCTGL